MPHKDGQKQPSLAAGLIVVNHLLKGLPLPPVSLTGDTGYSVGQLRGLLEEQDITAYIPIHPRRETSMVPVATSSIMATT